MLSEGGPSTSSTEQSVVDDVDTQAINLLGQGKRHLLVGDALAAVASLQDACALLAEKYGQIADECADVYYHYGIALLELGRMENGVLGNALQGAPDTVTDDEEETPIGKNNSIESAKALKDADDSAAKKDGDADDGDADGGDADDGDADDGDADDGDDGTAGEEEDTADDDGTAGDSTADEERAKEGEENVDDIPNFQLAWEMLELARIIYSRKQDKEFKMKVAQVFFKLGELGLETEDHKQSLDDFAKCLAIQKEHLEPESRLIAGSHYNLGLAYSFDENLDKAIEHYNHAKKVIQDRIAKLEKQLSGSKDEKEVEDTKKEVEELKELIPDISAKLEDAEDSKKQKAAAGVTSSGFDQPSSGDAAAEIKPIQQIQVKKSTDSKEALDISHLVRRKRKTEEEAENGAEKRSKQDGSGDATVTNGSSDNTLIKEVE